MRKRPWTLVPALLASLVVVPCLAQDGHGADGKGQGHGAEEQPFDLGDWMSRFHEKPDPDRVAWVISEMSREGFYEEDGPVGPAFLSEVFRRYPTRVAAWAKTAHGLPENDRHWIYLAVWWSQVPGWEDVLGGAVEGETEVLQEVLRGCIGNEPTPALLDLPITTPTQLDVLWACFAASGKAAYVERITTLLARPEPEPADRDLEKLMLRGAAQWSLMSNARQHADVFGILKELHARSDGTLHEELGTILESARPKPPEDGAEKRKEKEL